MRIILKLIQSNYSSSEAITGHIEQCKNLKIQMRSKTHVEWIEFVSTRWSDTTSLDEKWIANDTLEYLFTEVNHD